MMHTLAPWLSALVAASLKGSVILIAVLLAVRGMRRSSAEARHAILAIGLIAFLVIPVATVLSPAWAMISLPAVPADVVAAFDRVAGDDRVVGGVTEGASGRERPTPAHGEEARAAGARRGAAANARREGTKATDGTVISPDASTTVSGSLPSTALAQTTTSALRLPSRSEALMLAWLAGAALIGLRLLVGLLRLRFLSRRATMVTDGAWLQAAHAIARRLGLTRGVTLLRGDREAVPMTWGVLSPVVWLPPAADTWPAELRTSVLSHELAHVRRRDAVMQWIANVGVALHWFNPLVWVATRALRAERERACDDAVLALGAAPDDYAAHLLDMVRALGARGGPAPAMAMARRSQFEGRLLAILDRACSRAPVGAGRLMIAGAGAAALVLALGGLRTTDAARLPAIPADSAKRSLSTDTRIPIDAETRARDKSASQTAGQSEARVPAGRAPVAPVARSNTGDPVGAASPVASGGKVRAGTTAESIEANRSTRDEGAPATPPPALREDDDILSIQPSAGPPSPFTPAPVSFPSPPAINTRAPFQASTLSRNDTALLLDVIAAAEGISTSSDRVAVLERVASLPDLAPTVVTALGNAAGRVTSGASRTKLLRTIVRKQPHAIGESRRAVLGALSHEVNSTDFSAVLEDFVKRDSITEPALADAFTAAAKITSSTEKARVLVAAARHRKPEGTARAAYLKAASTISSGSDRARALSALFEDPPAERDGRAARH